MNGMDFIVAALALSAGGRVAPAGVMTDRTGNDAAGQGQSLWTAQAVVWNQPDPDPMVLTTPATTVVRGITSVPDFDRVTNPWATLDFASADETSVTRREPARWSAMSAPAGLPRFAAPTTRPDLDRRETEWSDPVGVLFAEESIRQSSGLARFIPAPGTAAMLLLTPIFATKRRRATDLSSGQRG